MSADQKIAEMPKLEQAKALNREEAEEKRSPESHVIADIAVIGLVFDDLRQPSIF